MDAGSDSAGDAAGVSGGAIRALSGDTSRNWPTHGTWEVGDILLLSGAEAAGQVRVFCGGGGSTAFIIDVTGYFLGG